MSFASALRDSAAAAPPPAADVFDISGKSVCVVDANALFKGVRPDRLADVAVTCAEVLAEVRDAASRAALAALPFGLAVRCAEPEHFAAVRRFARLTGDIGALSRPDIALLALARSLEVRQHGAGRLKDAPAPPRARPRRKAALATPTPLPGWDFVTDTEGWAALEAAEAAAEAAAAAAASPAHAAAPPPPPHHAAQTQQHAGSRVDASPKALQPAVADAHEGGDAKEEEGSSSEGDEGGGEWEAAVSRTVRVRRAKRASRAAEEASARAAAAEAAAAHRAALGLAGDAASDEAETEEEEEEEESEEEAGASDAAAAADDANPSTVCLVTADFPMQNVALQMGLRIVAPDGLRVKTLGCWAARCDACKGVTRDTQRHFCGRCGNAAMRKVQLLVDAHGNPGLRGTRYSLPAPVGGRRAKNPVLREDQLLSARLPSRGNKGPKDGGDVFAPEFGVDTLFERKGERGGGAGPSLLRAAGAPVVGAQRNPNERRHRLSNRRG